MTADGDHPPAVRTAVVVGTGLIGTSVAMALTARGVDVRLEDRDERALRQAADLGAGSPHPLGGPADVAVLAVPPDAVPAIVLDAQRRRLATTYTDVASIKAFAVEHVAAIGADPTSFVGGHPLAGRERSGPQAARADLFLGRPWVLTPSAAVGAEHQARAEALALLCGAVPVVMPAQAHDEAVALVSHAPQVVASILAARLLDADDAAVRLAGQGVRDTTRIAASDPGLWTSVLAGNATHVAGVLAAVRTDLDRVVAALEALAAGDAGARTVVTELLRRGNVGRARLPGKHGSAPQTYSVVPVVVADRPGELARLFAAAGDADVNIEDVAIEHSPGRPVGLVELAVRPEGAAHLASSLEAAGWTVSR